MKNKELIKLLPIKTERLIIKATSVEDIKLLIKMDKQEQTQRFLGGIKNISKKERIKFLEKKDKIYMEGKIKSLTVFLKNNTPIGFIGIDIDEENKSTEISYIFDYDYCKQGYCTEACKNIIEICFEKLKLEKIYADTIDGNINSIKVLEKLGFNHKRSKEKELCTEEKNHNIKFLYYELQVNEYKKIKEVNYE